MAWAKVRKWLWKSALLKRTRIIVVQAVVESSMLFDCNFRSWSVTDTTKIQSVVDKVYRFVWNNDKGQTLTRMQNESEYVRDQEATRHCLRTKKIEMRALYRFGNVLRLPNDRLTKKVVLGRWCEDREDAGCMRNSIVCYWRRLMLEAGEDWTIASYLARDKKRWKSVLRVREARMLQWELEMCEEKKGDPKPPRCTES